MTEAIIIVGVLAVMWLSARLYPPPPPIDLTPWLKNMTVPFGQFADALDSFKLSLAAEKVVEWPFEKVSDFLYTARAKFPYPEHDRGPSKVDVATEINMGTSITDWLRPGEVEVHWVSSIEDGGWVPTVTEGEEE